MALDLNDVPVQREPLPEFDLDDLSARLAERAREWVPELFPRGRIVGDELRLANIRGDAPRKEGSCVINLRGDKAGYWKDFSSSEPGGGPLSTLSKALNLHGQELLARAAEMVGYAPQRANGHDRSRNSDDRTKREIDRILAQCVPAKGTLVETYLRSRGLDLPDDCPDLLFHPDLNDYQAGRGWPGMVAIVRRGDSGEPTGGIHRTFLAEDGSAKANMPKPKMMLGPSDGVVRLMPIGEDGVLGIAEGIETSRAAAKIFGVPVWAALSTSGMRNFVSPPGLRRLMIFADRGEGGEAAAWHLHGRARMAGIEADVHLPRSDDDFARDLEIGITADAPAAPEPPAPEILPAVRVPRTYEEALALANTLTRSSGAPEIEPVLRGCLMLTPLALGDVLNLVKRKTGWAIGRLNDIVKIMRKEARVGAAAEASATDPTAVRSPENSDDALALKFSKQHGKTWRYVARFGTWLVWDGARWKPEDTLAACELARIIARKAANQCDDIYEALRIASARTVAAIERLARADRRHAATHDIWDADPWLLNTPGGIVDLHTGALLPHDPAQYMTKITAVAPDGDCPRWRSFLEQVTDGDADLQRFLQRVMGYALTGSTKEHALFFLYGTGGNGKGIFSNTVSAILGDYAKIAAMETFTATQGERHPTDLAMLRGARFVTSQETDDGSRWAESKIKAMTGGDPITARFMRQDFFTYVPQFKLVIAGNHKPGLRGVDEAIRRRLHLISFGVKVARPDTSLADKLRAEWPGILRWMIDGCLAWQNEGLNPPAIVRAATAEYLSDEDAVGRWIEECCVTGNSLWCASGDMWVSWQQWAGAHNEFVGTQRRLGNALDGHGFIRVKNEKDVRGYRGIGLKPTITPCPIYPLNLNDAEPQPQWPN